MSTQSPSPLPDNFWGNLEDDLKLPDFRKNFPISERQKQKLDQMLKRVQKGKPTIFYIEDSSIYAQTIGHMTNLPVVRENLLVTVNNNAVFTQLLESQSATPFSLTSLGEIIYILDWLTENKNKSALVLDLAINNLLKDLNPQQLREFKSFEFFDYLLTQVADPKLVSPIFYTNTAKTDTKIALQSLEFFKDQQHSNPVIIDKGSQGQNLIDVANELRTAILTAFIKLGVTE